jgi:hypothetical protein
LSKKLTWAISSGVWKLAFLVLLLCGVLVPNSEALIVCESPSVARTTSTRAGFGADCTAAQVDLESDTRAEAQAACESLGFDGLCFGSSVTVTKACAWNENHIAYRVAGYRTYRCATAVVEEN